MNAVLEHPLCGGSDPRRPPRRGHVVTHLMEDGARPDGAELARLIVRIASEQDRQAFARLYAYFAPRLHAFLRKSGLPANTAEEIAQEVMLSVWRKAGYFDPARAGAATWIFTIARNLRIDHLRRNRVVATAESAVPDEEGTAPSGEALLLTSEREASVRAAMQTLSDDQATVLRLSFFNDKAHSEIAAELGLPLGTVKSRVRLALGRLRALLEDKS